MRSAGRVESFNKFSLSMVSSFARRVTVFPSFCPTAFWFSLNGGASLLFNFLFSLWPVCPLLLSCRYYPVDFPRWKSDPGTCRNFPSTHTLQKIPVARTKIHQAVIAAASMAHPRQALTQNPLEHPHCNPGRIRIQSLRSCKTRGTKWSLTRGIPSLRNGSPSNSRSMHISNSERQNKAQ